MSPVRVERNFAAVRVYTPARSFYLNFDRLKVFVDLLKAGCGGPAARPTAAAVKATTAAFREQYPRLTTAEVHPYETAAYLVVTSGVSLDDAPER